MIRQVNILQSLLSELKTVFLLLHLEIYTLFFKKAFPLVFHISAKIIMHDKIIARVKILLKIKSDDIKFEAQSI